MVRRRWRFVLTAVVLGISLDTTSANGTLDDRLVTVRTPADVVARRAALIDFIWGVNSLPDALPRIHRLDASPVSGLENLAYVNTLVIEMEAEQTGYAHLFVPLQSNDRAVVLHHGHGCTFDDDRSPNDVGLGLQRTLNTLLAHGYSVATVYMPRHVQFDTTHVSVDDCAGITHDELLATVGVETGSALKFFLEPTAVTLNYLAKEFGFNDFAMVGLSGGGWTTAVYAAIDPRITLSVQVAGSMPLYLQQPDPQGDTEQRLEAFYEIAGYPDLYVLGSAGVGRRQLHILNRRDNCCFGEQQHSSELTGVPFVAGSREFEREVRTALYEIGGGSYRLEIDDVAPTHIISWSSVINHILPELNGGHQYIAAAAPDVAFVRGANGNLWHFDSGTWYDTEQPMAGGVAVLAGAVNTYDVFYRGPGNELRHGYLDTNGWHSEELAGPVASDPAAVSAAAGGFDVVALDTEYRVVHWRSRGGTTWSRVMSWTADSLGIGRPAFAASAAGQFHMFVQGRFDRALHYLSWNDTTKPHAIILPSTILDFPSAVVDGQGTVRAYVRDASSTLWEAAESSGAWLWTPVSAATSAQPIRGTPSASLVDGDITVHTQMATGSLGVFRRAREWQFSDVGGVITGSPTSIRGTAHARGLGGGLWVFDAGWRPKSGIFY